MTAPASKKRFRVALSFPGEKRPFVSQVADVLATTIGKQQVFYDKFHEAELTRLDLDDYLERIYRDESELIAIFLCAESKKPWCGLEWRAIKARRFEEGGSAIMPFRFDNAKIEGLHPTDAPLDINNRTADEIAALIVDRLDQGRSAETPGKRSAPRIPVEFTVELQRAVRQIRCVDGYKQLHDVLYEIKSNCYEILEREDFLEDVFEARRCRDALQRYVDDLVKKRSNRVVPEPAEMPDRHNCPQAEMSWISDLKNASDLLRDVVADGEALREARPLGKSPNEWRDRESALLKHLEEVRDVVRRTIVKKPEVINANLLVAARHLNLDQLLDNLRFLEGLEFKFQDSRNLYKHSDELVSLRRDFPGLIATHDQWQKVYTELRAIEVELNSHPIQESSPWWCLLKMFRQRPSLGSQRATQKMLSWWDRLKNLARPLYHSRSEQWARDLIKAEEYLESAIAKRQLSAVKISFDAYRRLLDMHFDHIDKDLLNSCERLGKVGNDLDDLLSKII